MLIWKISRFKFRVKHRINDYINDNSNEIGFKLIAKFCVKHNCIASDSYEDLMNGNKPKKRVIIIWIYNTLIWFMNMRFAILAVINER
jgi:hypothetical protein